MWRGPRCSWPRCRRTPRSRSSPSCPPGASCDTIQLSGNIASRREDRMVTMTETAAKKVSELRLEEGKPEWGLRIRVVGGGCSGMSYEFGWEDQAAADHNALHDKHSAPYREGSEIDFVDNNMMGAGFAIKNPNVKSSCGCGQSHRF